MPCGCYLVSPQIWTQQDDRWLPVDHWAACSVAIDEGELRGEPCYAGLDLASTADLCAFVLFFPSCGNAILSYSWVPQETVNALEAKSDPSYATWKRQGFLRTTGTRCVMAHIQYAPGMLRMLPSKKTLRGISNPAKRRVSKKLTGWFR